MTEARGARREARRKPEATGRSPKPTPPGAFPRFVPWLTFRIPHSAFRTPHSAFRVLHSAFRVSRGFSLVEMLAAMVVFGVFLIVLVGLQREFLRYDGEMRVALFTHPAPFSVLARLRRDILDSRGYPDSAGEWTQTPQTLLLDVIGDDGKTHVVIWDFSNQTTARRVELKDGQPFAAWEARAVPRYRIDNWEAPDGSTGLLVKAMDGEGNVVVDQIVTPRVR